MNTRNQLIVLLLVALSLVSGQSSVAHALESANYRIDESVVDYGGSLKVWGASGSEHSSMGQLRIGFGEQGDIQLQSGYLYYDDDAPLFPDPTAPITDPNFRYWVQNINVNSATFHIHVRDATVPDPDEYRLKSGLDLSRVYYKASPTGDAGTWGYSDAAGNWFALGDSLDPANWQRVGTVESSLAACAPHVACVTDTQGAFDQVSYVEPNQAETIRVNLDFTNHPAEDRVSGSTVIVFKIVDMAGNVSFSAEISSRPWMQTLGGDVHSNRKAIMFNPSPEANAAYIVSAADSIVNFESERDWVVSNYPAYLQLLEWAPLDYGTLIARAEAGGDLLDLQAGGGVLQSSNLNHFVTNPFGNQAVYYRDGSLTIGSGSGYAGVAEGGAATVVVDGDLMVTGDVVLNGDGYLAFLVRGNILISGTVGQMQGTYVADFGPNPNASGVINTGDDTANPLQLRVVGQLIARGGFIFNRIYAGSYGENLPAELIIYDPQVVINTPPGLKEVPSLGSWSETIPE
jgi:hypothetical protein